MEALNVEEGIALQAISQSPGSDTVSDTRTYPAETQNSSKKSVITRFSSRSFYFRCTNCFIRRFFSDCLISKQYTKKTLKHWWNLPNWACPYGWLWIKLLIKYWIKYWIYSIFWGKEKWHQEQLGPCTETRLKECFAYLINTTVSTQSLAIETDCGTYFKVSQNQTLKDFHYGTMALNCKLHLHEAYFACSLAIWLLPPAAYGTILTVAKYMVV